MDSLKALIEHPDDVSWTATLRELPPGEYTMGILYGTTSVYSTMLIEGSLHPITSKANAAGYRFTVQTPSAPEEKPSDTVEKQAEAVASPESAAETAPPESPAGSASSGGGTAEISKIELADKGEARYKSHFYLRVLDKNGLGVYWAMPKIKCYGAAQTYTWSVAESSQAKDESNDPIYGLYELMSIGGAGKDSPVECDFTISVGSEKITSQMISISQGETAEMRLDTVEQLAMSGKVTDCGGNALKGVRISGGPGETTDASGKYLITYKLTSPRSQFELAAQCAICAGARGKLTAADCVDTSTETTDSDGVFRVCNLPDFKCDTGADDLTEAPSYKRDADKVTVTWGMKDSFTSAEVVYTPSVGSQARASASKKDGKWTVVLPVPNYRRVAYNIVSNGKELSFRTGTEFYISPSVDSREDAGWSIAGQGSEGSPWSAQVKGVAWSVYCKLTKVTLDAEDDPTFEMNCLAKKAGEVSAIYLNTGSGSDVQALKNSEIGFSVPISCTVSVVSIDAAGKQLTLAFKNRST